MRLKFLLIGVVCLLFLNAQSQEPPVYEQNYESVPRASQNRGLFGKVTESKSNKGVEAASVQVFALMRNSEGEKYDSLIAGMLSKPNGDFNFTDLTLPDSFDIRITAQGFAENSKIVAMDRSDKANAWYGCRKHQACR